MSSYLTTASTIYVQGWDGEISELQHRSHNKPTEKRFFSKLNQTITQYDIEREREYQELEKKLKQNNNE
jgi:predicted nuclease of restriction endonuclease-like RecB superfamily